MVPGFDRVLRCARTIVLSALRQESSPSVVIRHAPTSRYLTADGMWTEDISEALVLDDAADAARVLERVSCEPVFDLVEPALATSAA